MTELLVGALDSFWVNTVYDILKFSLSYLLVRWLYDGVYKNWRFGGYQLRVIDVGEAGQSIEHTRRKMAAASVERILKDESELSVYIKGVVSPFKYLTMDIASKQAQEKKLLVIDSKSRLITVDLACCPEAAKANKPV